MNKLKLALAALLLLGIGGSIGRYLGPTKIEEKIIEKEVKQVDTHETTTIVKNPDGTVTTVIDKTDKTRITDSKTSDTKTTARPDWRVYGGAGYNIDQMKPSYIVGVDRRIIGEVTLGVYGTTSREVGVTVGISF